MKEGQKRGIFGSFSETVQPHNSIYIYIYMPMELILNLKSI